MNSIVDFERSDARVNLDLCVELIVRAVYRFASMTSEGTKLIWRRCKISCWIWIWRNREKISMLLKVMIFFLRKRMSTWAPQYEERHWHEQTQNLHEIDAKFYAESEFEEIKKKYPMRSELWIFFFWTELKLESAIPSDVDDVRRHITDIKSM